MIRPVSWYYTVTVVTLESHLTISNRTGKQCAPSILPYDEHSSPLASGADGVHSLLAAFAALESIRRGHTVIVDTIPRPIADRSLT